MTDAELAVVDCSVVVDALAMADASALRHQLTAMTLIAPGLLDYEVLSAVRGLNLGGHLTDTRAAEALADYAELAIDKVPLAPDHVSLAWAMRHRLTAYDATYVALAQSLGVPLLTRDRRLASSSSDDDEVVLL